MRQSSAKTHTHFATDSSATAAAHMCVQLRRSLFADGSMTHLCAGAVFACVIGGWRPSADSKCAGRYLSRLSDGAPVARAALASCS